MAETLDHHQRNTSANGTAPTVELDGDVLRIRDLAVVGSPAAAVRREVERDGDPETTVRHMLDIGGLVLQHGAAASLVESVVAEMRRDDESRAALKEMAERVSAKGLAYEDEIRPVLERVFAGFGDEVEATGSTPGLDGKNKKGDFVVTLDPASISGRVRRIVVEAKDKPSQRLGGKTGALTYLTDAMANRQADAGVLVSAQAVPALAGHRLRVYAGSRIIVYFEKDAGDSLALEVGCQLARAFAARAVTDEGGADPAILRARVEALREIVERASEIRGGALEARRGLDRVDTAYETLRAEALAVVGELEDRLSA